MEHHERLSAVRAQFESWGVDALLVGSPANRRWLSGFTGSAAWLLVTADEAWLATDFRYWDQATAQAPDFALHRLHSGERSGSQLLALTSVPRVGVEAHHITIAEGRELRQAAAESSALVPLAETVELLRERKSPAELALMARAAAFGDLAVAEMPRLARIGVTERELAWELEKVMRDAGADGTAFEIIVASGPNAALPHHRPGERRLAAGDAVVVDIGALVDGYRSDLTRTFYLGAEPDARFLEIYELVGRAQSAALNGMRPGMRGAEIDELARSVIRDAGHGDHFGHGLGHGVGLDIHELPRLGSSHTRPIPAGSVVTVEPGVYIPGWGGVRTEDLVLMTAEGPQLMSKAPKEPAIPL